MMTERLRNSLRALWSKLNQEGEELPSQGVLGQGYASYLSNRAQSNSPFAPAYGIAAAIQANREGERIADAQQAAAKQAERMASYDLGKSVLPAIINNAANLPYGMHSWTPEAGYQTDPVAGAAHNRFLEQKRLVENAETAGKAAQSLAQSGYDIPTDVVGQWLINPLAPNNVPRIGVFEGRVDPNVRFRGNIDLEIARIRAAAEAHAARLRAEGDEGATVTMITAPNGTPVEYQVRGTSGQIARYRLENPPTPGMGGGIGPFKSVQERQ